jgi:hypothetical protein
MNVISSPLLRHLDQIAGNQDRTPELRAKRFDTIKKVKEYILQGHGFTQWFAWIVGLDKQKTAIRALQEYGNAAETISEKDTVVDPWVLFTSFAVRDRHAELSKAFLGILNEMAQIHRKQTGVPDNYWDTKLSTMTPYCRRVHEDYVRIRDTPYTSEYTGGEYTYY